MAKKQLMIADVNMVFGKSEDPMLQWLDEIILPALQAPIVRNASENTRFIFENCQVAELDGELVLKGVIIKDMVVDVMSEYTDAKGLVQTDKHFPSSPYSVFIIFLNNHRMMLVKNQTSSPDVRSFKTSLKYTVREYITNENIKRKEKGAKLLPHVRLNISGIKTTQSVKDSLKDVEKITELSLQFFPLNSEWDLDPIFGEIDNSIRKVIGSKKGRMIFPSPQSTDGVAQIIERTDGLVKAKMKVIYKADTEKGQLQRKGTIKDNEISDVSEVDIQKELGESFEELHQCKAEYAALNVSSAHNQELYEGYCKKWRERQDG